MDYPVEDTTFALELEETGAGAEATLRLYDVLIPMLGIFIIVLNLLVVVSSGLLLEKRQQPRSCYILLGNLGLSDMLTGFAVLFGHFYPQRNDTVCALQIGMIVSSTLVSVFSVLLVAIDRFLYISNGLRYQQYMYPGRVRILIVIVWIFGTLVGFLPAMFPSLRHNMTGDQCWFILLNAELVLATTIIGVAPLFVVVILYSIILRKALRKVGEMKSATSNAVIASTNGDNLRFFVGNRGETAETTVVPLRQPSNESSDGWRCLCCCTKPSFVTQSPTEDAGLTATPRRQHPTRWKAIKVVMFTSGSFFVTWIPYFIVSTMFVYCDHEHNPEFCNGLKIAIASPLAILGFSFSLLNPIIYAWWHTGFRTNAARMYARRFERIKWCRWCFNKSNEIASSHRPTRTGNLSSTSNLSSGSSSTRTTTTAVSAAIVAVDLNANDVSAHTDVTPTCGNGVDVIERQSYSTNL